MTWEFHVAIWAGLAIGVGTIVVGGYIANGWVALAGSILVGLWIVFMLQLAGAMNSDV